MNLPNYITLTRIFSIPVLIWILTSSRFSSTNGERELLASFVFIAASLTDAIDGYLARRRAQVTTMGMLLDPVADKLLIAAAFITLVQFNPRIVPAWMAVIIIGREFLVSGLRSIAASEGFTIQASELGKSKMLVQIVSRGRGHHRPSLGASALVLPQPSRASHRAGFHLGDGGPVVAVGRRLFCRLLERRSIATPRSAASGVPSCSAGAGSATMSPLSESVARGTSLSESAEYSPAEREPAAATRPSVHSKPRSKSGRST